MDRISLLRERKKALKDAGKSVREEIASLADEGSFVELTAFSYSKNELFGVDAPGEGVITGHCTIDLYAYYIVAQNFEVSFGGLSKANCDKIVKTLSAAEKSNTPVIYLLHSRGVRVGEGVNVLEGIGELLVKANRLKGDVLQIAIIDGDVYGSAAALAALCDVVLFKGDAALCLNSPFVLSAKEGKNLKAAEVGGYGALNKSLLSALRARDIREAASYIRKIQDLVGLTIVNAELNEPAPALNQSVTAENIAALLEGGVELGANSYPEVKTILGRLGGISVAAVILDGMAVNAGNMAKIGRFARFASKQELPFVIFTDCLGAEMTMSASNSTLTLEIGEYLTVLDTIDSKIAVVTGRAVGLGYSLFAAKSAGFDFTFALATAQIALFEAEAGAEIEFGGKDAEKLAEVYAEKNADPFHAAKGGYLDDIVEPQFLKQYLIASLQTLIG